MDGAITLPISFDFQIAARTIWAEARGEPEAGQRAIAFVLVNRRRTGRWGYAFASVCVAPKQFSCWNDYDTNRGKMLELSDNDPLLIKFVGFLHDALVAVPDPTAGAMYYYAPNGLALHPVWAQDQPYIQIGNHRFFRTVNNSPPTAKIAN